MFKKVLGYLRKGFCFNVFFLDFLFRKKSLKIGSCGLIEFVVEYFIGKNWVNELKL